MVGTPASYSVNLGSNRRRSALTQEKCTILGYYAGVISTEVSVLPIGPMLMGFLFGFLDLEDGGDKLSRNVGKELLLLVRAQKNAVLSYFAVEA